MKVNPGLVKGFAALASGQLELMLPTEEDSGLRWFRLRSVRRIGKPSQGHAKIRQKLFQVLIDIS